MRVLVRPFPPAAPLAVAAGEVHVWLADLGDPAVPADVLAPAERERADRYRLPRTRDQFARSRSVLRTLLGGYLGVPPVDVPITVTADGKPVVPGDPLFFNLSHTDGLAAVAVAAVPVGVDVEAVRDVPTADALVERFFAPAEREQYAGLPADLRPAAFLRAWVCKEAVLKGVGCGARGLDRCAVDVDPRRPPAVVSLTGPAAAAGVDWGLHLWEPRAGYLAAVAMVEG